VHEDVGAVLTADETVTLFVVEPLDGANLIVGHRLLPSLRFGFPVCPATWERSGFLQASMQHNSPAAAHRRRAILF
jgi:hypothetical protein